MAVNEQDRLSSLPDDILIGIISHLPFKSAIDTAILSNRWRSLWTNLTSFDISIRNFQYLQEFLDVFDEFMKQITSPCIHALRLDFWVRIRYSEWQDSWLRQICNRNVQVLTLRWHTYYNQLKLEFPSFIFQTRSLISLELGSTYDWYLSHDCDQIDLPNLKNLSLDLSFLRREWLEKLIKSLPSLEDLSLQLRFNHKLGLYIKCSNENLRRLSIDLGSTEGSQVVINAPSLECQVVINAPSLEYLNVAAPICATLFFEVEPIVLHEAKIYIINQGFFVSNEGNRLISSFYKAISNVRNLTLDGFLLDNSMSTVFHTGISVTLRVEIMPENIVSMFSILDLCPQLDVLTLKISEIWKGYKHRGVFSEPSNVNPLRRVVRRIDIETDWTSYEKPAKFFLVFVRCLLSNAMVLKHFQFKVASHKWTRKGVENKRSQELEFCERLYKYEIASAECEVKFIGQYIEMSFEARSKDGRGFGEFLTFK